LAACRTGQELTEREEIGIGVVVEPASALDELAAKVSEMSDGAAEGGQAELQECSENRKGTAWTMRGYGGGGSND
jgi:hypothetical protein